MRGGSYIECVLRSKVSVDGTDATNICKEMVENTRHRKQLKVAMLDGIALGGFNVVNIQELYSATNLPIITVTRDNPDFEKIEKALRKNFEDWKDRLNLMKKGELHRIETSHNPIYMKCAGISSLSPSLYEFIIPLITLTAQNLC